MKVLYACQPFAKSIFLAGPTPRDLDTPSWRPEAIKILEQLKFDGTVIVPEPATTVRDWDYDDQVLWEWEGLSTATVVAFWIPRTLDKMPAFTTNVEFGLMMASQKIVMGFPPKAAKIRYLQELAKRFHVPIYNTLEGTMMRAITKASVSTTMFNQ